LLWILSLLGVGLDTDAAHLDADTGLGGIDFHFLGVGKIPFLLIITLVLFVFGVMGLGLDALISHLLSDFSPIVLSLMIAVLVFFPALFVSAFISRKLQPLFQDYGKAQTTYALVGQVAITDSNQVSENFGSAHIHVKGGHEIQISVRTFPQKPLIGVGRKVLIVEFNADKNIYYVEEMDS
jgi:membrane protein implicated in regulation of membrane protease activity